jgi:outer membrane protein, heavy metal efflux system
VTKTLWLIPALTLLSACAGYAPAALDPATILQQTENAEIDAAAVRKEIARLAPAADWDGHRLDALSLLAAALTTNPDIARARATVASAEADAKAAQNAPGPTLTLTSEYAFNAPESSPWLFGIASDITVDAGVRRGTRIAIADLNARIALFDFMDAAWSVRQKIRRALAGRLLAQQEIALAGELVALRQRLLLGMQHRVSAGAASHAELQRVRADLATDQQRLADADARAVAALAQLASAIGISRDHLDPQALSWPDINGPERLPDPLPASCQDQALLARPDIARASAAYDQAEAALRSAIAAQYPALHVGPGYTWERGLKKLPFALALSLPPLDLNRAAIDAAAARRTEAGRTLEATVFAASSAVELAQDGYRAAWVQLDNARQQTAIAERLAGQANASIAAGAIDRIDWSISQTALLSAKLAEIGALNVLRAAEAGLEDTLRRPLGGPELAITIDPTSAGESTCKPGSTAQL